MPMGRATPAAPAGRSRNGRGLGLQGPQQVGEVHTWEGAYTGIRGWWQQPSSGRPETLSTWGQAKPKPWKVRGHCSACRARTGTKDEGGVCWWYYGGGGGGHARSAENPPQAAGVPRWCQECGVDRPID